MTAEHRSLDAERSRLVAQVAELTAELDAIVSASQDVALDDEHDPDGATVGFERARVRALLEGARRRLAEVDEAQARLDAGTYGVCAGCGAAIPAERLAAVPGARMCTDCASSGRGATST